MFNLSLKSIILIISVIVIMYCLRRNKEGMVNTGDINKVVREEISKIYKADIQSIRNLEVISKKLQEGRLTIPGNLTIDGNITVKGSSNLRGNLENNSINNKINNINNNLNNKINNINNNLNSKFNEANSKISNVDSKYDTEWIYGTNRNGAIYRCKKPCSGGWVQIPGGLTHISQDNKKNGYVYGVNNSGGIYRCKKPCSGGWVQIPGGLYDIGG